AAGGSRPVWIARVAKPSAIAAPLALVGRQAISRGRRRRSGPFQDPGAEAAGPGGAAGAPPASLPAPPAAAALARSRTRARKRLPWAAPRTPRTTRTVPSRATSRVRRPDTSTADRSP